jgi:hypothetical protein
MSSIRTGVKTREEYIEAATISYAPAILALPTLKEYDLSLDKITFKELSVENDSVAASFLTSDMTEVNTAKISQKSHSFNTYGKVLKLKQDLRRNGAVNIQTFHDQILRQFAIQFDKIAYIGEGGNNGLITSSDANYLTQSSAEIPAISGDGFNQIQKAKEIAVALNLAVNDNTASTDLTVYFYGAALLAFLGKITPNQENDVKYHIRQAFSGKNVNFIEISALAVPASLSLGNGIIVVSNDLTTLEHCGLPDIENDGTNTEDNYYWANYLLGSVQVRPEVYGAVIKQVITFA